jgi:hypothetical protein
VPPPVAAARPVREEPGRGAYGEAEASAPLPPAGSPEAAALDAWCDGVHALLVATRRYSSQVGLTMTKVLREVPLAW